MIRARCCECFADHEYEKTSFEKSRESNELSGILVNNDGALYYKLSTRSRNQQSEPQRFLFVFVKNCLPEDHSDEETARFEVDGSGLEPIMCVDKPLE